MDEVLLLKIACLLKLICKSESKSRLAILSSNPLCCVLMVAITLGWWKALDMIHRGLDLPVDI